MTPYLVIIDFDLTITREHIHNMLVNAIYQGIIDKTNEAEWNYVKHVSPTGSQEKWRCLFEKLIEEGHDVAIASFGEYPLIIKRYLKEKIGLSDETLKEIFIESWLPVDLENAHKNQHIQNIITHFNYKEDVNHIILVDDSAINRREARAKGFTTIDVIPSDPKAKHIDRLLKFIS